MLHACSKASTGWLVLKGMDFKRQFLSANQRNKLMTQIDQFLSQTHLSCMALQRTHMKLANLRLAALIPLWIKYDPGVMLEV